MRRFRMASLSVVVAVGLCLPLIASSPSAAAASPRTTPPTGTQLAGLRAIDTRVHDHLARLVNAPIATVTPSSAELSGTRIFGWGFDAPVAIAADGGDLFVANEGGNSITEFSAAPSSG